MWSSGACCSQRTWRGAAASDGSSFSDLPFQTSWEASRAQAGAAGILLSLLLAPTLRLKGVYFGIVSLALASIVRLVLANWQQVTNGPVGLRQIAPPEPLLRYTDGEARIAWRFRAEEHLPVGYHRLRWRHRAPAQDLYPRPLLRLGARLRQLDLLLDECMARLVEHGDRPGQRRAQHGLLLGTQVAPPAAGHGLDRRRLDLPIEIRANQDWMATVHTLRSVEDLRRFIPTRAYLLQFHPSHAGKPLTESLIHRIRQQRNRPRALSYAWPQPSRKSKLNSRGSSTSPSWCKRHCHWCSYKRSNVLRHHRTVCHPRPQHIPSTSADSNR